MLSVRKISKSFGSPVVKDVSFDVRQGQYFVLLGASGVGKSVVLEIVAGLVQPDAGRVYLDGKDITAEKIQKRKTALVFQNSSLFPHMSVYDNIAYPISGSSGQIQIRQQVTKLAEEFEITHLLKNRASALSAGQAQRVSLARAVASQPKCLLLDEPVSSLDVKSRPQILGLLRRLNAKGQTIVHVTHDYVEAVSVGSNVAVMEDGRIAQMGSIRDIFQNPKSDFVARFIGIRNFFKGRLEQTSRDTGTTKRFITNGLDFSVLTAGPAGDGCIMFRSEDVIISNESSRTSARNVFEGTIIDIVPAGVGKEVVVDIGLEVATLITEESVKTLKLQCGKKIWLSIKASAIKFIEQ